MRATASLGYGCCMLSPSPAAGIGDALVGTCVTFARETGYHALTLWTHTVLESARRLYAAHGFACVETAVHERFGVPLQGETWRLELAA